MAFPFELSLASTSVLAIVIVLLYMVRSWRSRWIPDMDNKRRVGGKSLPGPWGIPLLGNMLSIGRSPPHISLTNLAQRFGSICQIRLGTRPVLVLNGYDAIHKALVKQAAIFAGRPQLFSSDLYLSLCPGNHNLSLGTNNERWMLHRKLAESSLRHFTAGSQVQVVRSVVTSEAMKLVERMKCRYIFNGDDNNLEDHTESSTYKGSHMHEMRNDICLTVANIMCRFLMGERRSYDDTEMSNLLFHSDHFSEANRNGNPVDFMPWLRVIMEKSTHKYISSLKDFRAVVLSMVKNHHQYYTPGSKQAILDHLVTSGQQSWNEESERVGLTEDMLLDTAVDLVGAGFETTSMTLEWCIMYMAAHPVIQVSLQSEIDKAIGSNRLPTLDDRADLPLIQAFILEVQRHANIVPFTIPHSTTEDTLLDGYFVPKDTIVFVNLYSALMDSLVWPEPEVFNPRRFLTLEGNLDVDKKNRVIQFGVGRRRCIGADLARMELFLFIAIFIQQFSFENPLEEDMDMEAEEGLTRRPKKLSVRIRSRVV